MSAPPLIGTDLAVSRVDGEEVLCGDGAAKAMCAELTIRKDATSTVDAADIAFVIFVRDALRREQWLWDDFGTCGIVE
jgi:hypothetical protein